MDSTILIIDDSENERSEIKRVLQTPPLFDRFLEAQDGIEGLKLLITEPVDLIICDLVMPNMDGFRFLEMLAAREELLGIPTIMLTASEDQKLKVKGLEYGACDFVTKPFDAEELLARVKVQLKLKRQQDTLKQSNRLLAELTTRDPLTQLHNRRAMMEILERELQRSNRKGSTLSIVIFDIDHFKVVNDEYGHQNGDTVLVAVADQSRAGLRGYDFVARYGGEEFVLILPDTPHNGALLVAERLRMRIEQLQFTGGLADIRVTVSLGIASYPAAEVTSVDSLIRAADAALYRAKREGRNRAESALHH
jgi:diguanylate cyclase (GGDEF)-like protein